MESFIDFLWGVSLFRAARDMTSPCSGAPDPELWLDIELERIDADPGYSTEERQQLIMTAKVADLFDDRKRWLLDEIRDDLEIMTKATA